MDALGLALTIVGTIFAVILIILAVLMPFFIYNISSKTSLIYDELKQIRDLLRK